MDLSILRHFVLDVIGFYFWQLLMLVWKFPEAVMEGCMPDSVSLLQQEIANCALKIQEIKVKLNRLSYPKTKEQFEQYNKCVQELDIARKVYQTKVQEFEELQSELLLKGRIFCYLLALLDFCLWLRTHGEVYIYCSNIDKSTHFLLKLNC